MLRGGLVLKIDEEKAHPPRSAFSFCCVGRVQPLWGLCGLGVRDRSLSVRYPQACREDSCQMGHCFFSVSDAHEVVRGAVMAYVVSAVFHLTHLVQWNKWPGSKCCFTVAESASPNISTDSVVLDTIFIYRQRLPLPLEDKCKKKRVGKAEEAQRGWTVWQLHAGHRSSSWIFWCLPERLPFLLLISRKHGGVWLIDSPDHAETASSQTVAGSQAGCIDWTEWQNCALLCRQPITCTL